MKQALKKAGVKLGVGLSLLAAVIGVRIVMATPKGIEAGIEELERLDRAMATEPDAGIEATQTPPSAEDDSIASRLTTGIREGLPKSNAGPRAGDTLVSCRMAAGTQYMRADDCAMRGGDSTIFVGKD